MKRIIYAALCLPALFTLSCVKDNPGTPADGKGTISVNAGTDKGVIIRKTRAVSEADFWLSITGPGGFDPIGRVLGTETTVSDIPAGDYTVSLISDKTYNESGAQPQFGNPVYYGTDTKPVVAGAVTSFALTCSQANSGVQFQLDESVTNYYANLSIRIEDMNDSSYGLNYTRENAEDEVEADRYAYFRPGTLKVTLKDGENTIKIAGKEYMELEAKAKWMWTVSFKTSMETPGGVSVSVTVDYDTEEHQNDLGIGDVSGDGSEASPYSVADAINAMPLENAWVEGIVTGPAMVTRAAANAFYIGTTSVSEPAKCIIIEVPSAESLLAQFADESAAGRKVKFLGNVKSKSDFTTSAIAVMDNIVNADYEDRDIGLNDGKAVTVSGKTLKDISASAGEIFRFGATIKSDDLKESAKAEAEREKQLLLLQRDFSSITFEYEMKMSTLVGAEKWRTDGMQEAIDLAQTYGIEIHGHTLMWYKDYPKSWWLTAKASEGIKSDIEDEDVKAMMEGYIESTMKKYYTVRSWDVVNEAFENATGEYRVDFRFEPNGTIYPNLWARAYGGGRESVKAAFLKAREVADAEYLDCKLFYNDYGTEDFVNKRRAITTEINSINDEYAAEHEGRLLIEGLGLQMHLVAGIEKSKLEAAIDAALETDCLIHISELSVSLADDEAQAPPMPSPELLELQAQTYRDLFDLIFTKIPKERLWGITLWGVNDTHSIYPNRQGMLFDAGFNAKKPYFEMIEKYAAMN